MAPPSSKFNDFSWLSWTTALNRRHRSLPSTGVASNWTPIALVSSARGSANIRTLPVAPWTSPQAPCTNASFTEIQTMTSAPAALRAS